jgi:hypothetical protein
MASDPARFPDGPMNHAEITLLKIIGDNIATQTRTLESFGVDLREVREKVIRLEEQKVSRVVEEVKATLSVALAKIDTLEAQRDKAEGARSLLGWIAKNTPWIISGLAMAAAGFISRGGIPGS